MNPLTIFWKIIMFKKYLEYFFNTSKLQNSRFLQLNLGLTSLNMFLEYIFMVQGQHSLEWTKNLTDRFHEFKGVKYLDVIYLKLL